MGPSPTRRLLSIARVAGVGAALAIAVVASVGVRRCLVVHAATRAAALAASSGGAADTALRVPHAPASIVIDGDTDDPGWLEAPGPARTGPFVFANGAPARPYSEARLLWGDEHLYVTLYAADEDIRARTNQPDGPLWIDDSFRMVFAQGGVEYSIELSASGAMTDAIRKNGGAPDYSWSSGAHVSHEMDGTLNDPTDMDEEWVLEIAIPFASIGMAGERGERIGLTIHRCDTPKGSPRVCSGWGEGEDHGRIQLD